MVWAVHTFNKHYIFYALYNTITTFRFGATLKGPWFIECVPAVCTQLYNYSLVQGYFIPNLKSII